MHNIELQGRADFSGWRDAARTLLRASVPPDHVQWSVPGESGSLFSDPADTSSLRTADAFTVPKSFLDLAETVAMHRDPGKFALLYRLLWRLRSEPRLMQVAIDDDVARAREMSRSVDREIHKMHAFVRFRAVRLDSTARYVAWFEPEHYILEAAAPFFVRRFANTRWSILTPERSAHWDLHTLQFGPGSRRADAPADDAHEDLWRTYYSSIFNPARLKIASMRQHMPKKYWRNLPESNLIPALIAGAQQRTDSMLDSEPTEPRRRTPGHHLAARMPPPVRAATIGELHQRAAQCRACPLWAQATQTVCGEGPPTARILLVGEQPGDQEDIAGRPFVGPAGHLLDRALAEAGIDRNGMYVTNAVKHFKFEPRGKRRIHKKPSDLEVAACRDWLFQEIALIRPEIIVALGATAARSILGRAVAVGATRGRILTSREAQAGDADVLVTVHPSYLLRVPEERKEAEYDQFVADLRLIRPTVRSLPSA